MNEININSKCVLRVTEQNGIELATKIAAEINPKLKVSVFKTYGTAMFKYNNLDLEFV